MAAGSAEPLGFLSHYSNWPGPASENPPVFVFVGSTVLGHQKYSGETTSFPQQLKITKEYNWNDGTVRKPPKGTEFGKTFHVGP